MAMIALGFVGVTPAPAQTLPPGVVTSPDDAEIETVEPEPAPVPTKKQNLKLAKLTPRVTPHTDKPYFIEFRSRSALSYGHTFAAFGRLLPGGRIGKFEVAGLHPAGDSTIPWSLGHVVAVPSETGPSDGDLEEEYVTARFRIDLTEAEYRKLLAHIRKLQNNSPMWHAVLYNCSAFVADIGKFMGLSAPNPLLFPADFINEMREMNASKIAFRQPAVQPPPLTER